MSERGKPLEDWFRKGVDIPEPASEDAGPLGFEQSGRLSLRIPKTLHTRVAQRAQAEGISINQFIATTLAQDGRKKAPALGVPGPRAGVRHKPLAKEVASSL
jgi:hypothetical protein